MQCSPIVFLPLFFYTYWETLRAPLPVFHFFWFIHFLIFISAAFPESSKFWDHIMEKFWNKGINKKQSENISCFHFTVKWHVPYQHLSQETLYWRNMKEGRDRQSEKVHLSEHSAPLPHCTKWNLWYVFGFDPQQNGTNGETEGLWVWW